MSVNSGRTIMGLSNGTTYYLVATALDSRGESAESDRVMNLPVQRNDFADNLTRYNTYQYDAEGRVTKLSSYEVELGNQLMSYITTEYNAAGNPVTISTYIAMGEAPMRTGYTVNEYDNDQNVIRTTSYKGFTGMATNWTIFEYNAAGDVTKSTEYNVAAMVTGYETNEYDAEGREIKVSSYTGRGSMSMW